MSEKVSRRTLYDRLVEKIEEKAESAYEILSKMTSNEAFLDEFIAMSKRIDCDGRRLQVAVEYKRSDETALEYFRRMANAITCISDGELWHSDKESKDGFVEWLHTYLGELLEDRSEKFTEEREIAIYTIDPYFDSIDKRIKHLEKIRSINVETFLSILAAEDIKKLYPELKDENGCVGITTYLQGKCIDHEGDTGLLTLEMKKDMYSPFIWGVSQQLMSLNLFFVYPDED